MERDASLDELALQNVNEGLELAFFGAPEGEGLGFLVELDLGFYAFKIKALEKFFARLVNGVVELLPVHFGRNIK